MSGTNAATYPLRTQVEQLAEVSSALGYQSIRCTTGCPMGFAMDLTPQYFHASKIALSPHHEVQR